MSLHSNTSGEARIADGTFGRAGEPSDGCDASGGGGLVGAGSRLRTAELVECPSPFTRTSLAIEFLTILTAQERVSVLALLSERARTVNEIADALEIYSSMLSYHLGVLFQHGIVQFESQGPQHVYSLHLCVTIRVRRTSMSIKMRLTAGSVLALSIPFIDPSGDEVLEWRRRFMRPRRLKRILPRNCPRS